LKNEIELLSKAWDAFGLPDVPEATMLKLCSLWLADCPNGMAEPSKRVLGLGAPGANPSFDARCGR